MSYLLTGVGLAAFSRPVVRIVAINGTLFTLNYTGRGSMMAEMTPATLVPNPVLLQSVNAVLNGSQIISVLIIMGFKNSDNQAVSLSIAVGKTSYAFVKNLGGGQTEAVTVALYEDPVPRAGDVLPTNVRGELINGSFFGFHSSVPVITG